MAKDMPPKVSGVPPGVPPLLGEEAAPPEDLGVVLERRPQCAVSHEVLR